MGANFFFVGAVPLLPRRSRRRPRTHFLPRATRRRSPNPRLQVETGPVDLPTARPNAIPDLPMKNAGVPVRPVFFWVFFLIGTGDASFSAPLRSRFLSCQFLGTFHRLRRCCLFAGGSRLGGLLPGFLFARHWRSVAPRMRASKVRQERWTSRFLRICINQVTHLWDAGNVTAQPHLQLAVRSCLPLMLTQMFRPRIHHEYLQIAIRDFSIAEDPPTVRAIATSYASIFMDRFYELRFPPSNHSVFDRNQHRRPRVQTSAPAAARATLSQRWSKPSLRTTNCGRSARGAAPEIG